MQMNPYLSFKGDCEAAFKFYERCLGGQQPQGFAMSLHIKSTADAERIFDELASGGRVVMSLEKTFWSANFGMVVDRFGIHWFINCEGDQPTES